MNLGTLITRKVLDMPTPTWMDKCKEMSFEYISFFVPNDISQFNDDELLELNRHWVACGDTICSNSRMKSSLLFLLNLGPQTQLFDKDFNLSSLTSFDAASESSAQEVLLYQNPSAPSNLSIVSTKDSLQCYVDKIKVLDVILSDVPVKLDSYACNTFVPGTWMFDLMDVVDDIKEHARYKEALSLKSCQHVLDSLTSPT